MIILGVDPGLTGAIAAVNWRGEFLDLADMPTVARATSDAVVRNEVDPRALAVILRDWSARHAWAPETVVAFLERVNAMPSVPGKDGKRRTLGAATGFSLGDSFGAIRGVIAARFISVEYVYPQTWKRAYQLKGPDKDLARATALKFYPSAPLDRKKDHGRAEALLIARYGAHRMEEAESSGTLPEIPF